MIEGRRAPRLSSRTYLAPYITRRGRFRKVDPSRGRPLPGLAKLAGALGWALLLGESLRRAWKAHRATAEPQAAGAADPDALEPGDLAG